MKNKNMTSREKAMAKAAGKAPMKGGQIRKTAKAKKGC